MTSRTKQENNLRKHRHLELISDNNEFSLYRLNIGEIREVWEVKKLLKDFDHSDTHPSPDKNGALHQTLLETIECQRQLIADLQKMKISTSDLN